MSKRLSKYGLLRAQLDLANEEIMELRWRLGRAESDAYFKYRQQFERDTAHLKAQLDRMMQLHLDIAARQAHPLMLVPDNGLGAQLNVNSAADLCAAKTGEKS